MKTLSKHKKVIVLRLSAIGDVAMVVPVLWSFSKSNLNAEITLASQGFAKGFIQHIPGIDFFEVDLKGRHKGFKGIFRLFFDLRKHGKWDLVIDLHDVIRTKFLTMLFSICRVSVVRIDKGRKDKAALTRIPNKVFKELESTISRYNRVFSDAGFEFSIQFDYLFTKAPLDDKIISIVGLKEHRWIGIAPFAKHQGKIYPLPMMEQVVNKLSSNPSIKLLFFGGGGQEQALLESWEKKYPNSISLAQKFTIEEELKIISNLDVMLAMDSANMHFASLVNIPVISIWGATHPYAGFYGWNQNPTHAVQVGLPCRPCSIYGNKPCFRKDYACLNNITPDMVISKLYAEIIH